MTETVSLGINIKKKSREINITLESLPEDEYQSSILKNVFLLSLPLDFKCDDV